MKNKRGIFPPKNRPRDAHLSDHYHLLQDSIDALGDEDLHLSEDSPVLKKE
jgi:hypothetical protein